MKKVVKFGGSSLASAEQFRKAADIIHADKERRYVVPSAPGKRFTEDAKVTDMLYPIAHTILVPPASNAPSLIFFLLMLFIITEMFSIFVLFMK